MKLRAREKAKRVATRAILPTATLIASTRGVYLLRKDGKLKQTEPLS